MVEVGSICSGSKYVYPFQLPPFPSPLADKREERTEATQDSEVDETASNSTMTSAVNSPAPSHGCAECVCICAHVCGVCICAHVCGVCVCGVCVCVCVCVRVHYFFFTRMYMRVACLGRGSIPSHCRRPLSASPTVRWAPTSSSPTRRGSGQSCWSGGRLHSTSMPTSSCSQ